MESLPLYEAVKAETGIDPVDVIIVERPTHEEMLAPFHRRVEEIYTQQIGLDDLTTAESKPQKKTPARKPRSNTRTTKPKTVAQ